MFKVLIGLLGLLSSFVIAKEISPKLYPHQKGTYCQAPFFQLLKKKSYHLCYQHQHRLAAWTIHWLEEEDIKGKTKRTNDYRADLELAYPVQSSDYRGSGMDRGHLVPAADRKRSREHMSETFYMSNMTPQHPKLNQGVWNSLESYIRSQILKRGTALIVTGPVLTLGLPEFRSGITLPDYYFKAVYFPSDRSVLTFLIPNENTGKKKWQEFQISLETLEAETDLGFFTFLESQLK